MDLITKCNACEPPVREWLDTKTLNCWVDKIHLSALPPSLHTQQQILFIYFWLEVVHLLYLIMCWNYILQFTIYIYITCVLALYPYWISQLLNTDFHLMNGPKLLSLKKFTQTRFWIHKPECKKQKMKLYLLLFLSHVLANWCL